MSLIVRDAVDADIPAIARVHVDSWRTTYKGIVPDAYLATLSYEGREASWHGHKGYRHLLVAERDGTIGGFISGCASREPELGYGSEVTAIYLLHSQQGAGMGTALFNAMTARLKTDGHKSMHLWVLADNPARHFYVAQGGQKFTEKTITLAGKPLLEHGYAWPRI